MQGMNIRDIASINELAILSNLESANADMIRNSISRLERFQKLLEIARYQLEILNKQDFLKSLKKTKQDIYLEGGIQKSSSE